MRTFHSRNSHSSAGVAGGTGAAAGIAQEQIHLYYSWRKGGVKESIESLIAKAVANSRKRQYPAHKTQQDPMKRLLLLALTAATLLVGTSASAHCDGKHGHQDTTTQESGRQRG